MAMPTMTSSSPSFTTFISQLCPGSQFSLFHGRSFTSLLSSSAFNSIIKPAFTKTISIRCVNKQKVTSSTSGSDPRAGVALYKPKSYEVLVTDAANSLAYALGDGKTRLEIDFP